VISGKLPLEGSGVAVTEGVGDGVGSADLLTFKVIDALARSEAMISSPWNVCSLAAIATVP
jgi:hypothetical protein